MRSSAFRVVSLHLPSMTPVARVRVSSPVVSCVRASASSCCACCGLALVGEGGGEGESDVVWVVSVGALGRGGTHNSCWGRGMKLLGEESRRVRLLGARVWRPLDGPLPVWDELTSHFRGVSEDFDVQAWEGRTIRTRSGTRLVELGKGAK